MACPLPVDIENSLQHSFSLCRCLLHIWVLLSCFPEDFCSLHWTTAFQLLFSHVHFIFKLSDTCVADSASWDPFQPATIFLWLCVLLGSLGLSLLGLGCFLSALPWNETSIVAEPFLDWEKQQGYFMYLVRDTSVCKIMDFFCYNIACSCLQCCVPFPKQLRISHMEFHLDSIFLIF